MKEKTVLVTGSSRGIGLGIAYKFGLCGYKVILNSRKNSTLLKEIQKDMTKKGIKSIISTADVSSHTETSALFSKIKSIDVLVNNAGISHIGLFADMKPHEWKNIINNNLYSAFNTSHLAIPLMLKQKSGVIINISSVWGEKGASCEAAYSASKGGVNSFTKSLAKELGPSGIRVNAISCGFINTDMNIEFSNEDRQLIIDSISLNRAGDINEVADLAYFLACDEAKYITGQIIGLDGGMI